MTKDLQVKAIRLRKRGFSLNEIVTRLGCAKSSASLWTRGIILTKKQAYRLRENQDNGRRKAANHPNSPRNKWAAIRNKIIERSKKEIPKRYNKINITIACSALYWAEGYKKTNSLFVFANTDPQMIKLMMAFLVDVCKVPLKSIKGRVNIHPMHDGVISQQYWSLISGIPKAQFYKPLTAIPRSSKGKRKTLPYGTFRIIICDVLFCSRIFGWIEGIKNWVIAGK